ncbi:cytosine deaminase [Marinomonas ostreistagni]|uniref:Cytosine deaminase n=1 Tax=Marinomonas ostreistagni TaxID=359209 RepID=A0ABS0ZC26_9GAMM|nr:cytosine deaminase [Marinomonas ostreistagni]MBJ7550506.1 cytosine deaminase [Marinomonas ostreistagni]
MKIINARLRHSDALFTIECEQGVFTHIQQQEQPLQTTCDLDAKQKLLCAPFVEPHIHLDAVLTAGEPRWNKSGTLFEGIECWSERKKMLSHDDVQQRVLKAAELLISHGVQHIRTHVDVTDPELTALKAIVPLKQTLAPYLDLQVVAFPQEGILSYPNGKGLMEQALEIGADVIGGIPHFEFTREYGVESMLWVIELAQKHNKLVDVHCDEIDDENSRFLEVLATATLESGLGNRVTASHTVAMHSYNNAYCSKLFRLLKMSGINFVSCPTENIHLQGRFDTFPKRRGITRVKELRDAGINVALAQDSIQDPWYSLGNGKLLRQVDFALHACHMMGYDDFSHALDFITDNGAKVMHIQDHYGIEVGKPANFIVLNGADDVEVIREQAEIIYSVRKGEIMVERQPTLLVNNPKLL